MAFRNKYQGVLQKPNQLISLLRPKQNPGLRVMWGAVKVSLTCGTISRGAISVQDMKRIPYSILRRLTYDSWPVLFCKVLTWKQQWNNLTEIRSHQAYGNRLSSKRRLWHLLDSPLGSSFVACKEPGTLECLLSFAHCFWPKLLICS